MNNIMVGTTPWTKREDVILKAAINKQVSRQNTKTLLENYGYVRSINAISSRIRRLNTPNNYAAKRFKDGELMDLFLSTYNSAIHYINHHFSKPKKSVWKRFLGM